MMDKETSHLWPTFLECPHIRATKLKEFYCTLFFSITEQTDI